jgi:hypothetical protein
MELNNGRSHVCIETVYHKNLVLRGHSFILVTKSNSVNLDWIGLNALGRTVAAIASYEIKMPIFVTAF